MTRVRRPKDTAPATIDEAKVLEWIKEAEDRLTRKVIALLKDSDRFNMERVERFLGNSEDDAWQAQLARAAVASSDESFLSSEQEEPISTAATRNAGAMVFNPHRYLTDLLDERYVRQHEFGVAIAHRDRVMQWLTTNRSSDWSMRDELLHERVSQPNHRPIAVEVRRGARQSAGLYMPEPQVWNANDTFQLSSARIILTIGREVALFTGCGVGLCSRGSTINLPGPWLIVDIATR